MKAQSDRNRRIANPQCTVSLFTRQTPKCALFGNVFSRPSCSIDPAFLPLPRLLRTKPQWYNRRAMEDQALRVAPEPETSITDQQSWALTFQAMELDNILMRHARWATSLASVASDVETQWWLSVRSVEAAHLPAALGIINKIDRMRAGMVDEALRVAEIVRGVPRSRMHVTVKDSNVVVAPASRRASQAR